MFYFILRLDHLLFFAYLAGLFNHCFFIRFSVKGFVAKSKGILEWFHILLGFIYHHIRVFRSEIRKHSFVFEIDNFLLLPILPDLRNCCFLYLFRILLLFSTEEHIFNGNVMYFIILMFLLDIIWAQSPRSDSLAEYSVKVEFVFRQKLHAIKFANHHIVISFRVCFRSDINIVHKRLISALFIDKNRQSQLYNSKIIWCLFYFFVKFDMVAEYSFYVLQFAY